MKMTLKKHLSLYNGICVLLLFIFMGIQLKAQEPDAMRSFHQHEMQRYNDFIARSITYRGDTTIDVTFYHLDIKIGIDSPYISGSVICQFEPLIDQLNSLQLDLNHALTVDSISAPCSSFLQDGDHINIQLDNNYNIGASIEIQIYYQGVPIEAGGYKGLRYETHHGDQPIIATLSTPYLAHYWYPCKDGPQDKADSVYIDITIPKQTINGLELIAVSNGLLVNTLDNGATKTFQWRHRYPIVTYYVMAAVSNYAQFQQTFTGSMGESFPIDYYVFREDSAKQHQDMASFPLVMDYFSELFGTYPFVNEKYGMTQLGYYGAIENQTNTIINAMTVGWFRVTVHELCHMWFADMITCANWHHGWLNEGFASYSEALWKGHAYSDSAYHQQMNQMQFFDEGTLYLENAADTFHVFSTIIYYKGAYTLHMLRGVVGDSLFFESLKNYATDPDFMYQHAITEDLQEIFETTCNLDLGYFFEQWVYDEYYPIYEYNYSRENDSLVLLILKQTQQQYDRRPVFTMPVRLNILFSDGSDTLISVWNDQLIQQYAIQLDKEVDSIEVDPEKWILREAYLNPNIAVGGNELRPLPDIQLYPNPFNSQIYLQIKGAGDYPYSCRIYNAKGHLLQSKVTAYPSTEVILLNEHPAGIYIYSVYNGHNECIKSGKLIKK